MDGVQSEMLQRITRVETKVDNMDEKLDRAINANETAVEALASATGQRTIDWTKLKMVKSGSGVQSPGLLFWQ